MTAIELALVGKEHGLREVRLIVLQPGFIWGRWYPVCGAFDTVFNPGNKTWEGAFAAEARCPDREAKWDAVIYLLQQDQL